MGDLQKFVSFMITACRDWSLGYSQSDRQNIKDGGNCDCSSLAIFGAKHAGFDTGNATYTGNMSAEFTKRGWVRVPAGGNPRKGDILLSDAHHVAVYVGNGMLAQASIDERGEIAGGAPGDQTGWETNVRPYYDYPWDCYLRYTGGQTQSVGWQTSEDPYNPNGYDEAYVCRVQEALNAKGYNLVVDGILGPKTFAAVKEYQVKNGLVMDGIPGPNTMGALAPIPKPEELRRRYTDITGIQGALHCEADNVNGPITSGHLQAVKDTSEAFWADLGPEGIKCAQMAVGAEDDGVWGPISRACHDTTVGNLQRALNNLGYTLDVDEVYGPKTDWAAWDALSKAQQA